MGRIHAALQKTNADLYRKSLLDGLGDVYLCDSVTRSIHLCLCWLADYRPDRDNEPMLSKSNLERFLWPKRRKIRNEKMIRRSVTTKR